NHFPDLSLHASVDFAKLSYRVSFKPKFDCTPDVGRRMAKDAPNLKADESCNADLVVILPFVVTGELWSALFTRLAFVACILKRFLSNLFPRFCLPEYSIRTDTPKRLRDKFRN